MAYLPQSDAQTSGSLAALNAVLILPLTGQSGATIDISGTWVGTITFQGSVDGTTNFGNINAVAATTSGPLPTTTVNGLYRLTPGGFGAIQVIMTAFTSGSATIKIRVGGVAGIFANQILPTKNTDGTSTQAIKAASTPAVATDPAAVVAISPNNIVAVSLATAPTTPVTGTFFQATQPVSGPITDTQIRATPLPVTMSNTLALTDTQLRATAVPISLATAPTTPVTGTFFQATQPISAVALPLPTGAALDSTQTNGTAQSKITDGTNVANVLKADGTSAGQNSQLVSQTDLVSNGTITTQNLNLNTGVPTAGSFVGPLTLSGSSMVGIQLSGTYTGVIVPQVSNDGGANWVTLSAGGIFYKKSNGTSLNTLTAESGFFQIAIAGAGLFRLTMSNAPSGSAVINMRSTNASNVVTVGAALPAGTFQIGNVGQGGTWSFGSNSPTGAATPGNAFLMGTSDGTNLQALRGNESVTLLASAARTTTQTSADLINFNGASVIDVILDMTVVGTGSVTVTVNGKDPASGKYYLLLSGAAVITNVTNVYRVGLGLTAVGNATANFSIPRIFQIVVTANNANTATYSVGYNIMRG